MRWPAALVLLLTLALAACGDEDGTPSPSASPQPTPSPSPSATPLPSLPPEAEAYRLVFVRPISPDDEDFIGQLWTSRLDGSAAAPLTPDGVTAAFAGTAGSTSYYVEFQGTDRILWAAEPGAADPREVLRFRARYESQGFAQVSPDGTRIAYVDYDSVYLLDLASGETRLLLQGSSGPCDMGPGDCYTYRTLWWSPDGSLLAAMKVYYEGSDIVVIDPEDPVERIVADEAFYFAWSPAGDAVCVAGHYAATSAVHVARAPDWAATQTFFGEFEPDPRATPRLVGGTPVPLGTVTGCGWTDADYVLAAISHVDDEGSSSLAVVDLGSGEAKLREIDQQDDPWSRDLVTTTGGRFAVTQAYPRKQDNRTLLQPLIFDTTDRHFIPVLQPGDWVVAVVAP